MQRRSESGPYSPRSGATAPAKCAAPLPSPPPLSLSHWQISLPPPASPAACQQRETRAFYRARSRYAAIRCGSMIRAMYHVRNHNKNNFIITYYVAPRVSSASISGRAIRTAEAGAVGDLRALRRVYASRRGERNDARLADTRELTRSTSGSIFA